MDSSTDLNQLLNSLAPDTRNRVVMLMGQAHDVFPGLTDVEVARSLVAEMEHETETDERGAGAAPVMPADLPALLFYGFPPRWISSPNGPEAFSGPWQGASRSGVLKTH